MRKEARRDRSGKKLSWREQLVGVGFVLVLVPLIPVLIVVGILFAVAWYVWATWLGFLVRTRWYPQGKRLLFVYSNSPVWQAYIEASILPRISAQAVIINWSERSQWNWERWPLELQVFHHWTWVVRYTLKGKVKWEGANFNPIAITFVPWWKVRVFRFWQPFKDFKHGKERPLKEMEARLFRTLKLPDEPTS